MTAQQIRKTKFEHDDGAWESARWLQEIAAQLAELNERNKQLSDVTLREIEKINKLRRPLVRVRRLRRRRP